jgi:tetratricopeptide (TPR) repeat protein
MAPNRFRIAFSFAGEKRAFVAEAARLVAERFGQDAILYDRFHESEFADADLAFDLPALYRDQSDVIVAVFCPDYDKKEWCGLEWRAIFSLIKEGRSKRVLLSRFGLADGKGLFGLGGFIDLDNKTPDQFAGLILERLALNEGRGKDHYTKSATIVSGGPRTSIPHNLPWLQPFFGREKELLKIAEALEPESRTWGALIDGPGGIGKTSLAVRAAYAVPLDAFDRIVFVSLKARELDDSGVLALSGFLITGLAELFGELARELGHGDITKTAEDKRPRLLIDILRTTRALLILDNLESLSRSELDALFAFVKKLPAGSKAILTSRGRIGSGAEELILQSLSQSAALATLARLAEGNPAIARTSESERIALYEETGGNPLLLRWTAGQIGRGSCLTLADAILHLRSCPQGNDPLEFVFGDLVDEFTEIETRVLSALTYFTLPAETEHLAELLAISKEETRSTLASLVNRSLVVPSDDLRTFSLVSLVTHFLCKKRPQAVANTGSHLQDRVSTFVVENGYEKHLRFPLLNAAWPTIAAALPLFLAGPSDRLQQICNALRTFLNFSGRWDERLALSRDAERSALASGQLEEAGWRAHDAGWVHFLRKEPTELLECAGRAEAHWSQSGARERAIATTLRGFGHELEKDYVAAAAAYREVVRLFRTVGPDGVDVAIGLSNLADAEHDCGNLDEAEQHYTEGLEIARAVGYREGIAGAACNLATLSIDRKDYIRAESLAADALPLADELGRKELIANLCCLLAEARLRQGEKATALAPAQRAVDLYTDLGSTELGKARNILRDVQG